MNKLYEVIFTKEEIDSLLIQIRARIDALKELQVIEAKAGNVERVLEIEKGLEPIISGKDKMIKERCNL